MDTVGEFQFADLVPRSRVLVVLQAIRHARPCLLVGAGVVQVAVAAGDQGKWQHNRGRS